MSARPDAPIILRRRKIVVGGGHHGGAWKVAYADFVTAMMAFFLLMWLLGATNENQRKGIADYFNPTIPINKVSGGGEGAFGGESVFSEMTLSRSGTGADFVRPTDAQRARGATGADPEADGAPQDSSEGALYEDLARRLEGSGGESMVSELLQRHIITRVTDEGLVVEIFDLPGAATFDGDDRPEPRFRDIVRLVAEVFRLAENPVAIRGHVARTPRAVRIDRVWDASVARAMAARAALLAPGFPPARIARVEGHGDRDLASGNALAPRNNRIEFVLLRSR